MAFSATDAALEGFRIGRHKPGVMLAWAAASLVIGLITSIAMVLMFGGTMNELMSGQGQANGDATAAVRLMGRMAQMYLLIAPIVLVVFSIFTAAVYRAVLRPADSAFAYLRLGATELRIAVVLVVLTLLSIVISFALTIVVGILAGIVGVAAFGAGNGGAAAAGLLMIVIVYILMIGAMLAFWTKFSLAAPMTFAEKRIRIFESWKATKGYFWPLFGSYLLSFVLGMLVSLLGAAISLSLMAALGGTGNATDIFGLLQSLEADYSSLASFLTPAVIANMVVNAIFSALTYAIFLAPPAVAYRDIVAVKSPALADAFS